jgi:hypothetical protein
MAVILVLMPNTNATDSYHSTIKIPCSPVHGALAGGAAGEKLLPLIGHAYAAQLIGKSA